MTGSPVVATDPPSMKSDAATIASMDAIYAEIKRRAQADPGILQLLAERLIAVQWPSLSVPVLACRALFLQIRRNRLLPQVEREICQSPHSSVLAASPTNQ